ncbi:hypothetical protein PI172_0503 [Prevotella intermedia]|uniref:Uncharacterized protein n=1 Tax=Prevotella intermedia TaxID=28131 RepID=A0AAD1BI77_PREIN|nr:hypothetical protein PI172_0503 [Prevotella intermedia]
MVPSIISKGLHIISFFQLNKAVLPLHHCFCTPYYIQAEKATNV